MKTTSGNDRFKIIHNGISPQKGYVLISEPFLSDAYFQRSVIFLINHNEEEGSMGFILNKPTGVSFDALFEGFEFMNDIQIFLGGPVSNDKLFYLHTLGDLIPDSMPIGNDIYMNGDFEVVCNYIRKGNDVKGNIKFFLGYSGWGAGQLNDEITDNTWLVNRLNKKDIFLGESEELWKKSLLSLDDEYKKWIYYPKNPSLN